MRAETALLNLLPCKPGTFLEAPDVVKGKYDHGLGDLGRLEELLHKLHECNGANWRADVWVGWGPQGNMKGLAAMSGRWHPKKGEARTRGSRPSLQV